MNSTFVSGNLVRDAELKEFTSAKVAKFSIAVNTGKNKDGEKEVAFLDCAAWNKTAEIAMELRKGDAVAVDAFIKQENWEKDGQKRSKLVFNVQRILKLAKRDKPENTDHQPTGTELDENVPF